MCSDERLAREALSAEKNVCRTAALYESLLGRE
jgi:hypothetical protein